MIKPVPVTFCLALVATVAVLLPLPVFAGGPPKNEGAPVFTADGRLMPPQGYYHWVFLTSDLGMSYSEDGSGSDHPPFSNVFVNPAAYRAFLKTGTWPDKTVLVKEFRRSSTQGSINRNGYFQTGKALSILVHVKDTTRYKGGWAFFAFGDGAAAKPARMIPTTADCYSCHQAHGAVDTTFVQFYPTLLPIAKKHSTLSADYLRDEAKHAQATP
ncbi:MAG: cytochrome P460 family protein [Ktedonobacteraceae bacterium]